MRCLLLLKRKEFIKKMLEAEELGRIGLLSRISELKRNVKNRVSAFFRK